MPMQTHTHTHKENKRAFPAFYHKIRSMFSEVIGHIKMLLLKGVCLVSFRELVSQ